MEINIKSKKILEAIGILDKLIELESDERECPWLNAHLHAYNGEIELARRGFNELLKIDHFRVEAYHGLVIAASQEESGEELENIEKKVEEAMKLCKKENRKSDLRDFKLLFAQIPATGPIFNKGPKQASALTLKTGMALPVSDWASIVQSFVHL